MMNPHSSLFQNGRTASKLCQNWVIFAVVGTKNSHEEKSKSHEEKSKIKWKVITCQKIRIKSKSHIRSQVTKKSKRQRKVKNWLKKSRRQQKSRKVTKNQKEEKSCAENFQEITSLWACREERATFRFPSKKRRLRGPMKLLRAYLFSRSLSFLLTVQRCYVFLCKCQSSCLYITTSIIFHSKGESSKESSDVHLPYRVDWPARTNGAWFGISKQ